MEQRVPPQNIEAEQSVLGAMLIDKNAVIQVMENLRPEDFYREAHRVIFTVMAGLQANNEPVDLITVTDGLKKIDKLEAVGGVSYITMLADSVPTAANVKYHAQIVEEKSVLRQLVEGGTQIAALGYEGAEDARDILDSAEKMILEISNRKGGGDFTEIRSVVTETLSAIEKLAESNGKVTGISTGYKDLDNLTAGLHPSDFIILAARPSMGKTALALNICQNVAIRSKMEDGRHPHVAFFSLEMSRQQLVQRMLCAEAAVNAQRLRVGQVDENDWANLWAAADRLAEAPIYIDDTPGLSIMEMRSRARRLKTQQGLDMIVVDYLQLMQGSKSKSNADNRQQEVSEISRGLKALARELDVPVIALSQLSRSVESRQIKKPMLSDLRESGSLEQDADLVIFLYRADYYKQEDEEATNTTELIVAKHRNGPVGRVDLFFNNEITRFDDLSFRGDM